MATASISYPHQAPITCNICDGSANVDWYCLICKGPMCGTCQINHKQTTMFRKHEIVPIAEGLTQVVEEECCLHPSYICSMHCNACHQLICTKCISSGKHRNHDIGEIKRKPVSKNHLLIDTAILHRAKFDKEISLIAPVDGNQAWVKVYRQNELRLVDIDGKEVKCVTSKFYICDFAVTTSGDIITTDYNGRCIRIMTQTGQVTQTINTKPNIPTGVCLGNNDQEIAVCVNTSDLQSSKLVVYSRDLKEKRTITFTDKPVERLVTQRVTQNNRGDYCVAHYGHRKVYVVDTNGGVKRMYDGSGGGETEKDFVPGDVCSDIYNHLFISDYNNHKIHMLDDECNFLRFILTEQDGITKPYGLCIDKGGRLWVGQIDGGLSIVKYLK